MIKVKKCVIIHLNRAIWVVTACKMVSISMQTESKLSVAVRSAPIICAASMQTVYAYRIQSQSMRANIV